MTIMLLCHVIHGNGWHCTVHCVHRAYEFTNSHSHTLSPARALARSLFGSQIFAVHLRAHVRLHALSFSSSCSVLISINSSLTCACTRFSNRKSECFARWKLWRISNFLCTLVERTFVRLNWNVCSATQRRRRRRLIFPSHSGSQRHSNFPQQTITTDYYINYANNAEYKQKANAVTAAVATVTITVTSHQLPPSLPLSPPRPNAAKFYFWMVDVILRRRHGFSMFLSLFFFYFAFHLLNSVVFVILIAFTSYWAVDGPFF